VPQAHNTTGVEGHSWAEGLRSGCRVEPEPEARYPNAMEWISKATPFGLPQMQETVAHGPDCQVTP